MLLWQLFLVFTRVAFFSWGGGPGSLGLMQREVIAAGWMTADEFADGMALSNVLPGPIAPQASAFVGYKLAGLPGAVVAVAGTVLPTTILLLIAVAYFYRVKEQHLGQGDAHGRAPRGRRPAGLDHLCGGKPGLQRRQAGVEGCADPGLGQAGHRRRHVLSADLHPGQPRLHHPRRGSAGADSLSVAERILRTCASSTLTVIP